MFINGSWLLLMLVSVVIGGLTQSYINSTYRRWSRIPLSSGLPGAEVARRVLQYNQIGDLEITSIGGNLTDSYDPRSKRLSLSEGVYGTPSVAAAGVAAHEAGHAVQDARGYVWGRVRGAMVPVVSFGSSSAGVLIILGFILGIGSSIGNSLLWLGIIAYSAAVLFQVVTLPVELDASRRAMSSLEGSGVMAADQLVGARQVLTAAALTYVAAALISILQLAYYIGLARRD